MKVVQSDIGILKSNKIFVRKSFDPTIVLTKNYFWYYNNIRVDIETEENLEKEYQKTLIPTKTPNPSEEKGYLAKADANGETPEVDNPVPLIDKKDELILKSLQLILSDISSRRGNHVIQKELESFLQNGRETE